MPAVAYFRMHTLRWRFVNYLTIQSIGLSESRHVSHVIADYVVSS